MGPARSLASLVALTVLALGPAPACGAPAPAELADPDVPGRTANPDGLPYPTDHIGSQKRVARTPGDRIPNLTFQAYIDGDVSKGLQIVSLADFYDPGQKTLLLFPEKAISLLCSANELNALSV